METIDIVAQWLDDHEYKWSYSEHRTRAAYEASRQQAKLGIVPHFTEIWVYYPGTQGVQVNFVGEDVYAVPMFSEAMAFPIKMSNPDFFSQFEERLCDLGVPRAL